MLKQLTPDVCVIGGGSAGLSFAAGAAQFGADTVLVEAGKMGGDCLNYGCVPSKSLIASAHATHAAKHAGHLGVSVAGIKIDPVRVRAHVQNAIRTIEPHDSVERFEGLGVTVLQDHARFIHSDEIVVGSHRVRAKRFVVATGSRPAVPPIPGLDQTPYLTNETIFTHEEPITELIVIGGGPIGCELAQAFARLGTKVSLIDIDTILPRDDPQMRALVKDQMVEDGVLVLEKASVDRVEPGPTVHLTVGGEVQILKGSHILVATGRIPNIDQLSLDLAGVKTDRRGIKVNARLRSNNRRIYAIGDCNGIAQFTHAAGYQAGVAIKNILFKIPAKASACIPRVTYTDPELAYAGKTEAELQDDGIVYQTVITGFDRNDRAIAEARTQGFCKLLVSAKGRILGAGIVGSHAGELIQPWVMAIDQTLTLSEIASSVVAYPTLAEINKRAAGQYFTPKLFNDRVRWWVKTLMKWC